LKKIISANIPVTAAIKKIYGMLRMNAEKDAHIFAAECVATRKCVEPLVMDLKGGNKNGD
jgi:hypothetical protein